MEIKGKNYEILEIIQKSNYPEQDLYVCMSEYGYKECFQRYDLEKQYVDARNKVFGWTDEEKFKIKQLIAAGKTLSEIVQLYSSKSHSASSIYNFAWKCKKEMEQ